MSASGGPVERNVDEHIEDELEQELNDDDQEFFHDLVSLFRGHPMRSSGPVVILTWFSRPLLVLA